MSDEQELRARALDPNRSFIVQAPAGSGKTTLLVHRMLRLLTTVKHPEQIIAISFTRKAAEEMRSRIIRELELAHEVEPNDKFLRIGHSLAKAVLIHDEQLQWNLILHPSRLRIMTIDALCASLIRQMPLTARISGVQAVETDPRKLYQEAARNAVKAVAEGGADGKAIARMLHYVDNDWGKLERLLSEMLGRRDQWLRLLSLGTCRDVLEDSFVRIVESELARTYEALPSKIETALTEVCAFAGLNVAMDERTSRLSALADLTVFPTIKFERLEQWQGIADLLLTKDGNWRKRFDKTIGFPPNSTESRVQKEQLQTIISQLAKSPEIKQKLRHLQRLPGTAFEDDAWDVCTALIGLMTAAAAHLVIVSERRGRTDFAEISMAANEALGTCDDPEELALRMDYHLQHLLVDEFQDTSVTQLELLVRLTGGWTEGDGRSLFLVGDPMQSIYRFRQADVRLFTDVARRGLLGNVAVEYLQLKENFRSQKNIVRWVNDALPKAMVTVDSFDVPFVPQRSVNVETETALNVLPAVTAHDETEQILGAIADIRTRSPRATIAVLVRSRLHLGGIITPLLTNGYSIVAREIQPLGELPWVSDLVALTRALLHPADRVAWLAVLRAPWCGLALASLHELAQRPGTLLEAMYDEGSNGSIDFNDRIRLCRTRDILATAVDVSSDHTLVELVEQTWLALGGPACLDDESGFDDVRAFFSLLQKLGQDELVPTAERVESRVEDLFAVPRKTDVNAIEIMTIHRAKGLEFDYVIIPGAGRTPRSAQKQLLIWREDIDQMQRSALMLAAIPTVGTNASYDYLRERENDEMAAEAIRLLYVAVTRARNAVYIAGQVRRDRNGRLLPLKGSFLSMLWPVLAASFVHSTSSPIPNPVIQSGIKGSLPLRRFDLKSFPDYESRWHDCDLAVSMEESLEFDWAGTTAKHVGTVTHQLLQQLNMDNCEKGVWIETTQHYARGQLRSLGVSGDELDGAVQQVGRAFETTLVSERGAWLFSNRHTQIDAEMALSTLHEERVLHAIVDRSFIDAEGTRWIVDFKVGRHTGGSPEAYLDSEVARYRPQLERYGRIIQNMEDRPVMLGLYFPLLDAWREWAYVVN